MGWRDLLESGDDSVVSPWAGGRELRFNGRTARIGRLPPAPGWHRFTFRARVASWHCAADPAPESLGYVVTGYLVGDRLVRDDASVDPSPSTIASHSEPVHLVEDGVDRFTRVSAGRTHQGGPLFFRSVEMPLGPEPEVLDAFLERRPDVSHVRGVTPALDAAFRMEAWQRAEAERRRAELDRRRAEEERRRQIVEKLGDGSGRREMAAVDFAQAATAALAVGGARYLDSRQGRGRRDEMVVTFSFMNRRFECTCDRGTLQIIDSGICLTAHDDDDEFEGGTKGDSFFTLESLPSVIKEAIDTHRLVVYRHVA